MRLSSRFLKGVRLTHLYLGVFVAPAILFFAFTGAIQTFSLHETTRGSSYQPHRILVVLGQIHKKQTPVIQEKKPQAAPKSEAQGHTAPNADHGGAGASEPTPAPPRPAEAAEAAPTHNPLPLKIFFLLVSISLFCSTLSGIYMAYAYSRNKVAISTLILFGAVIPALMVLL
jgi:hypothetical protein